ncbi:MAG TPA: ATP-binding cassette domain-containing protein [Jiangellaceae bacterium]|jgi:ABC-2 type transport system ATP-binding protein|nr:ATP-binding cassette domain-containing protein [Jiangellaceae bacterium]
MSDLAVRAEGLWKRFGSTTALAGLDLAVPAGTVCGLLGPNGAGKTTAVRILSTLLRFNTGYAEVAGFDVVSEPDEVRSRIGLTGQYAAVDEVLSGRQNLVMFGRLFGLSRAVARRRAGELLDQFELGDAAGRSVGQYSGGMRRRLDLAASLICRPEVLFLDEPTTGLDPRGRNQVWDAVRFLVAEGTTVVLTTQYLEEADQLTDRISVIAAGRVVADGTPDQLKSATGGDRVEVVVHRADDLALAVEIIERVTSTRPAVDPENRSLTASVTDRIGALTEVLHTLQGAGVAVEDIGVRRPTLDEAFLHLTGDVAVNEEAVA